MSSTRHRIVPARRGDFLEMWGDLRSLGEVTVPLRLAADPAPTGSPPIRRGGHLHLQTENALAELIRCTWHGEGNELGIIFTDADLLPADVVLLTVPTRAALERYYHHPRQVSVVAFNPALPEIALRPAAYGSGRMLATPPFSWQVPRLTLPRLIGMLRSIDPAGCTCPHEELAGIALSEDRIYEAFHHACLGREEHGWEEELIFTEIRALLALNEVAEASQHLELYRRRNGAAPERTLLEARFRSIAGRPHEAVELSHPLRHHPELAALAALEGGIALLMSHRYAEATEAFSTVLEQSPSAAEALLGRGLALRGEFFDSGDEAGLRRAAADLEAAAAHGSFRAPEANHHAGTVYVRLKEWARAERCFRATLGALESPASRRNLVLVLHGQGRPEEARREYEFLCAVAPGDAAGLEPLFAGPPRSAVPAGPIVPAHILYDHEATRATAQLQSWNMPITGDLLDFRRLDEYLTWHAPGGEFLSSCVFHGLGAEDQANVIRAIAMHLSGILVRGGFGVWEPHPRGILLGVAVRMHDLMTWPEPLCFYDIVRHRLATGAAADNLTSLDFLVSPLPGYEELARAYVGPIEVQGATPAEQREYRRLAEHSRGVLGRLGWELTGELSDLAALDEAMSELYPEGDMSTLPERVAAAGGEETQLFLFGLGLHLGFVCQECLEGVWLAHPSLAGVSITSPLLNTLYPVQLLLRRLKAGGVPDPIVVLKALEVPLVCARLARMVERHEITTRAEVARLMAEAVPELVEEDPTGSALERVVDLIYPGREM